MLKQTSDIVSQKNGDITQVIRFTSGPVRQCANCPCLLVMGDRDGDIVSVKKGYCSYYVAELTPGGDFPKRCRVAAITVEETM